MSDTTPEVAPVVSEAGPVMNPEEVAKVEIEVEADPNVEYVKRAKDVLSRLENMPMGSHETRMLKEAILTVFGPAIMEAEKHVKMD